MKKWRRMYREQWRKQKGNWGREGINKNDDGMKNAGKQGKERERSCEVGGRVDYMNRIIKRLKNSIRIYGEEKRRRRRKDGWE